MIEAKEYWNLQPKRIYQFFIKVTPLPFFAIKNTLPLVKSVKFLGLHLQSRHLWSLILRKAKSLSTVISLSLPPSILCALSSTMVPLFRTSLPPASHLKSLDIIQSSAIRISTSAFRTSLAISVCAEAGIPPPPPPQIHAYCKTFNFHSRIRRYPRSWTSLQKPLQTHTPPESWSPCSAQPWTYSLPSIEVPLHTHSHPIRTIMAHQFTPSYSQADRIFQIINSSRIVPRSFPWSPHFFSGIYTLFHRRVEN